MALYKSSRHYFKENLGKGDTSWMHKKWQLSTYS